MADTYLKKVQVTDELSTAEARAERLRRLRNLANLSRKDMCNTDLNFNTLKAWELARFGGLPKDGADKVIRRIAKEGVICTADWLLYGKGITPQLTTERELITEFRAIIHDMRTPLATASMGVSAVLDVLDHIEQIPLQKIKTLLTNALIEVNQLNLKLDDFTKILKEHNHES